MERKFSKFKKLSNKPRTERKEEVKRIDAEIESLRFPGTQYLILGKLEA